MIWGAILVFVGFAVAAIGLIPIGLILMLVGIGSFVMGFLRGAGKLAVKGASVAIQSMTTKKCEYCKSVIDVNASICPMCNSKLVASDQVQEIEAVE